jgi:hypothetical protein
MGYKIISPARENHTCDIPKVFFFERKKFVNMVIQCDCGKQWKYKWEYDSQGGWWDWHEEYK